MSQLVSISLDVSQSVVLGGLGVRALTDTEKNGIISAAQIRYERLKVQATKNRDDLVALKELADPSELTRILTKAEGLVKTSPEAACNLLARCQGIFDAQNNQATQRRQEKIAYESVLNTAQLALTQLRVVASVDPLPLEDLVLAAQGLAERGQYAAAKAKLDAHSKVATAQRQKAGTELAKQGEFTTQLGLAVTALGSLQGPDLKDLADPSELELRIETAKVHQKARRFASGLEALGEHKKLSDGLLKTARDLKTKRDEYNTRSALCKSKIETLQAPDPTAKVCFNDVAELLIMSQTAAGLAGTNDFAGAVKALTKLEATEQKIITKANQSKAKKSEYTTKRGTADTHLAELKRTAPLTNPEKLQARINEAEIWAGKHQYVEAIKALGDTAALVTKQQKKAEKGRPALEKYQRDLTTAEGLLNTLSSLPLSTPGPLEQIIILAKSAAGAGNFDLAAKTLKNAAAIATEQTRLARAEATSKASYLSTLALAEAELNKLAVFGELADSTTLQKQITTAKGLAGLDRNASALQALAGYDVEAAKQLQAARDNQRDKGLYAGKLGSANTEFAKLKGENHKKLMTAGIQRAELLAQQNRFVDAVAEMEVQLAFAREQLRGQVELERLARQYETSKNEAVVKKTKLETRDRGDLLGPGATTLERAILQADQGKYDLALSRLLVVHEMLDAATLAANLDDEKQALYITERTNADGEIARLLSLAKPVSPERLQQMVSQAEAVAGTKRFAEAYEAIKNHTTLYNELVSLANSEDSKKGKYPKQEKAAETALGQLRAKPSVSPEGVKEAEDLLALAKTQAGEGKFVSALATLVEFNTVCTRVGNEADQEVARKAANEKHGPKYTQRRDECTALLNELATLPGAEDAVAKLRVKLKASEDAFKRNDLKGASVALKGAADKAREAKTANAKAIDDIGKITGTFGKDYGKIKDLTKDQQGKLTEASNAFQVARGKAQTAMGTLRDVARPKELTPFEKRVTDALALAVGASEQRDFTVGLGKITTATRDLETLALELIGRQGVLDQAKRTSTTLATKVENMIKGLWLIARAEEIGTFDERLKTAQNLINARQFEAADRILNGIEPKLTKKDATVKQDMAIWEAANLKLTALLSGLTGYADIPALADSIQSIKDQIAALRTMRVGQEKNYRLAAEEAGYVLEQSAMLDDVKRLNTAFATRRTEAGNLVTAEDDKVGVAFESLKGAMKKAGGKDRFPGDLTTRRAAVLAAWQKKLAAAFNEPSLDIATTIADLQKLVTDAKETEKNPGAANTAEDSRQARVAFETSRDATEKDITALRARAGNEAGDYEDGFKVLLGRAEANWAKATTDMNALGNRVRTYATQLEGNRNAAAVKARTRAATATSEIDSLQKGLKKFFSLSNDLGDEFAAFFDAAKKQIAEMEGMRSSGNLNTILAADTELDAIMSRVRVAAADARNTTPGERSFKAVVELRKKIKGILDDSTEIKTCLPTEHARVLKEFAELIGKITEMEPGAAHDALMVFNDSVIPIERTAKAAAKTRKEILAAVTKAKTTLGPLKASAPTYYATLSKRIKQAEADGKKERGETNALTVLTSLQGEIEKALDPALTSPIALAGKEKGCREDALALKNAKTNWEATLNVFETKTLAAAQKAVAKHPKGDKTQIDGLQNLRDKAKEAAKMGDYAGAVKQLAAATKVAQRAIEAPQGLRNSSRDNLPGVGARWRTAVEQVNAGITDVSTKLKKLGETEQIEDLASITRELDALVTGPLAFNPTVFNDAVATLSKENNALAERRAAREAGMRWVRQYKERLKDPVLMVLYTNNPFGTVPLNLVNAALDDLDLNIQRCV